MSHSRYSGAEEHWIEDAEGREVRYKKARVVSDASVYSLHIVSEGYRADHLAYRYYGDPERFWQLCDANDVMWPEDLVGEPGQVLVVPVVEG